MAKRFVFMLSAVWGAVGLLRAEPLAEGNDSVGVVTSLPKETSQKSGNVFRWVARYLRNTNKPTDKAFDFSVLLGPSYSASTSLGLGGTASGLYSWDRRDTLLPKSNVSLFANASLSGMLAIGLKGNNFLPHDRYRFNYQLLLYTFPSYFWGIGYDQGRNDENKSKYDCINLLFKPDFLFRINSRIYAGPTMSLKWVNSYGHENTALLGGQSQSVLSWGIGFNLTYDTRDFVLNAYRGNYFRVEQLFYPSFMGNDYAFSSTDLTYSAYRQVWKGGVLAMELHTLFNYGEVPWTLLAQVGGQGRMRGYYEGRYRDRNIMEGQVELRQHIKGRNGIVLWVGCANVFKNFDHIWMEQLLPNYGVGYRWEFKKRVNIRLDWGFTKDSPNMTFNINEAF